MQEFEPLTSELGIRQQHPAWRTLIYGPSNSYQFINCYAHQIPEDRVFIVGAAPCGDHTLPWPASHEVFGIGAQPALGYPGNGGVTLVMPKRIKRSIRGEYPDTTHVTEYKNFNAFDEPELIEERNSLYPGQVRVTTRTYTNRHPTNFDTPEVPYILNLLTSETVTLNGESVTRSWTYDALGFKTSETANGITTTFQPDAYGNVASATNANGHTTSFSYEWDVVKNTTMPKYTITRAINPDGSVQSETQAGRTTTYGYDAMGRRTLVDPPGESLPTTTTYNETTRTIVTARGASTTTATLDGFGRAIATVNSAGIETRTEYDAEGRAVKRSLPFFTGQTPEWTEYEYDGADRVTRETHPDGTFRQYTYTTPGVVTARDENGHTTTATRRAFGHPLAGPTVKLTDATGQDWHYGYHVTGQLGVVVGPGGVMRTWTYDANWKLLTETHPESGTFTIDEFTGAGQVRRAHDARETQFYTEYDDNGRVILSRATPVIGPVQETTFTYETGTDRRATATVNGVTTTLTYDAPTGRVTSRTDVVGGASFQTSYTYDPRDNVTSITYPSGRVVHYAYDAESRLTKVCRVACATATATELYADQFDYAASGALKSYRAGNGVVTTLTYDPERLWLSGIIVGNATTHFSATYDYDDVGNIKEIVDGLRPQWSQEFDYDVLDRLTGASAGIYGELGYTYDAHGNRLRGGHMIDGQPAVEFTYDTGFRLMNIGGGPALGYDNNGNQTTAPGLIYTYNATNQMSSSSRLGEVTQYLYDADQWRVKKTVGTQAPVFSVRGLTGQLLSEWTNTTPDATVRDYIYAGGRLIGVMTTHRTAK